jgi:hypothetical protein
VELFVLLPPKIFGCELEIFRPDLSYVSKPPKMFGLVDVFVPSVHVVSTPLKMLGREVQLAEAMDENPTVTTVLITKLALTIAALIFLTTHFPRQQLVVA